MQGSIFRLQAGGPNDEKPAMGFVFIFRIITALLLAQLWAGNGSCPTHAQRLRRVTYEVFNQRVSVKQPKHQEELDLGRLFGGRDQVFLGLQPNGHYYLMVGNVRSEGDMLSTYAEISVGESPSPSPGYLIRFPRIPRKQVRQWIATMSRRTHVNGFRISCVHSACTALRDGFGIRIAGSSGPDVLLTPALRRILENGFVDAKGRPVRIEIYQTSSEVVSPERLAERYKSYDRFYTAATVTRYAIIGVLILGGGSMVYILLQTPDGPRDTAQ